MSNHQVLNNADHRDLRVLTEPGADRGDGVMAALITPAEFRRAQGDFPIVFRRNDEHGEFYVITDPRGVFAYDVSDPRSPQLLDFVLLDQGSGGDGGGFGGWWFRRLRREATACS